MSQQSRTMNQVVFEQTSWQYGAASACQKNTIFATSELVLAGVDIEIGPRCYSGDLGICNQFNQGLSNQIVHQNG